MQEYHGGAHWRDKTAISARIFCCIYISGDGADVDGPCVIAMQFLFRSSARHRTSLFTRERSSLHRKGGIVLPSSWQLVPPTIAGCSSYIVPVVSPCRCKKRSWWWGVHTGTDQWRSNVISSDSHSLRVDATTEFPLT